MSISPLLCWFEYLLVAILRYGRYACLGVLEDVWLYYCQGCISLDCFVVQKSVLDGLSLSCV